MNGLSPSGSGYQSSSQDKTPSPIASNMVPQALVSPSTTNMSVAAIVSPTTSGGLDPRRPISIESSSNGVMLGETLAPGMIGLRRESVDSRINQGFSDMRLGTSPYATNNQSSTSIQNTLHNQRNPRAGLENLSVHRISNGYQPSNDRNPDNKTTKTAPAITGPATGHIARAAEPTKGQAWAFPEEDIQRVGVPQYTDSRRSSITESVASSQFTTESRLPPGQRGLDDSEYSRMSNASDFPPVHHHTMQHKQLSDLQAEEGNGPSGSQPYSRTPELRVSHKLAERKRRTEMKELFDQLRDLMPQERGSKASKWEILTKGEFHLVASTHGFMTNTSQRLPSIKDKRILFVPCNHTTTPQRRRMRCSVVSCRDFGWRVPNSEESSTQARRIPLHPLHRRRLNNSNNHRKLPTRLIPMPTRPGPSCHLSAPSATTCLMVLSL